MEGILGLRPDLDGIKISPSIPKDWAHLEIEKDFRGKHLHIVIDNPNQQENGCEKLIVNDKEVGCNYIPETLLEETNQIQLIL